MAEEGGHFTSGNHFREELGRRTLEVQDLRDELAAARDRALDAEDRTSELQQKIARLEADIAVRKVKGGELEQRVSTEENEGAEARWRYKAAEEQHAADVARIWGEIQDAHNVQARAEAESKQARTRAEELEGEAGALRARIEAMRRDAEHQQEEFTRDEAAEEARQARLAALELQRGEEQINEAKAMLDQTSGQVTSAQNDVMRMEAALAMEREYSTGLEAALNNTVERNKVAVTQCEALSRVLETRQAMESEGDLRQRLLASKSRCQELTQELAGTKRDSLMGTQTLQGAIEETRRMLDDHLDQTAKHLEETQRCPESSPLADLIAMLSDARSRVAQLVEKKVQLEVEKSCLELEVRQDEEALAAEKQRAVHQRLETVEHDLAKGRQELESSSRFAGSAQETMRRVEDSVAEIERASNQREALLRSKLQELWRALRQAQPGP